MLGTASEEGYFTELNPAWELCLGWTSEELMAEPFISFVHPDDVEATIEQAAALAKPGTKSVAAFENRYRTRDGDYRNLQWTTVADDGVMYFSVKDVSDRSATPTEHEQAELRIRQSDTLHRTLTANLPDTSVFLLDHDLRILVAEGEAISRLPWSHEDQFQGRKVTELFDEVPEDVLQLSLESYRAALRGERRAFEFLSNGLTMAVQAVPVRADDGTVEAVLAVVRDVTERTGAEQLIARRARPAEGDRRPRSLRASRATTWAT